ncbi:MAG: hypothetical protein IEMM0002_0438 [bacterium]|nr:MAG: hypothetical protein IEMM0002_0438 [bacterium]
MALFYAKRIADPVHGTIGLTKLEVELINTKSFQRLRNVNQLGLAHFVYPGANYSRFSHSLGTCHIVGLIFDSLLNKAEENKKEKIQNNIQLYRIAALLHDIGHYPFSHPMERAIKKYYDRKPDSIIEPKESNGNDRQNKPTSKSDTHDTYFKHEDVAKEILEKDEEIKGIFEKEEISGEEVYKIISWKSSIPYANLVSSDMDADRMDYMLRTSYHTGLPYGSVDIKYIISQLCIDDKDQLYVTSKAMRAVDHFLLCRYFDYQQVYYHKTVTGFELTLQDVIKELLKKKRLDCSASSISERIKSGEWHDFDDSFILQMIRDCCKSRSKKNYKLKAESILMRKPPKLVFQVEFIRDRDEGKSDFSFKIKTLKGMIKQWSEKFEIDEELWLSWDNAMFLTEVGPHVPVSLLEKKQLQEKEALEQLVHVSDKTGKNKKPIVEMENSLMSILSKYAIYSFRIYVLLEGSKSEQDTKQKEIEQEIKQEYPELQLK